MLNKKAPEANAFGAFLFSSCSFLDSKSKPGKPEPKAKGISRKAAKAAKKIFKSCFGRLRARLSGRTIVTLPAYHQIEGTEIGKLVQARDAVDVAIGHRNPRAGGGFERVRRAAFHRLLSWVTRLQLRDVGCTARAMDRRVLEEIQLYGDHQRYLPVLADRQGFRVREVDVRQSPKDRFEGTYRPREYTRVLLDLFTVFFLVRFTKKPLRFFGMIGVTTFAFGALAVLVMVFERLFFGHGLTERPAFVI